MPKANESEQEQEIQRLLKLVHELNEENERLAVENESLRNNTPSEASSHGGALGDLLDAEERGERWVPLDKTNSIRAADIRQIEEFRKTSVDTIHEGVRRWMHWPYPMLKINDRIEVQYPLWSRAELLELIGAAEVPMLRTEEEVQWEKGDRIGEGQTKM